MKDLHAIRRVKRHKFLQTVPLFKDLNAGKLNDLNDIAGEIQYSAGDTIYEVGFESSTIYLVREGSVVVDTSIEIDNYFKFPTDKH